MTDDGVHSLQLEEGRSAVVSCISSPRLWKVLVSFDGGLRSQRARAAHHRPRRGTPSKTEHVDKKRKNRMRPPSVPLKKSVSLTRLHHNCGAITNASASKTCCEAQHRIVH